ncbi:MAG TPA: ABC transporter permease [Ktedonobacteraceae bacterium]|nr:ABC transporter permease [Ktedonobacteraceae bacterium]
MGRYIIRRLLQAIPLLIMVSIVVFTLIHLIPGGAEAVFLNPKLTGAARQAIRHNLGLDQPVYIQYLLWIKGAVTGNFGHSFVDGQTVISDVGARVGPTVELFGSALLFALILAIPLGVTSAVRQYSIVDYTITFFSYFGISMPIFFFAIIMQEIFAAKLGWLPDFGRSSDAVFASPFDYFLDGLLHLILPMLVLSLAFMAGWSRYMRASMLEVKRQDYMRTARSKGLGPVAILARHGLRNALIPVLTVVAIDFGAIAGGAAVTETIFAWPGLGSFFIESLTGRDYPVLMAMLLMSAVMVILFNLLADVLYGVLDPRIRYS